MSIKYRKIDQIKELKQENNRKTHTMKYAQSKNKRRKYIAINMARHTNTTLNRKRKNKHLHRTQCSAVTHAKCWKKYVGFSSFTCIQISKTIHNTLIGISTNFIHLRIAKPKYATPSSLHGILRRIVLKAECKYCKKLQQFNPNVGGFHRKCQILA